MADYQLTFATSARRDLEGLDPPVGRRILTKIESLQKNPRPAGCVKLVGSSDQWRIRVGDWRVIYTIDDRAGIVDIVGVRHRSDAYR